MMCVYEMNAPCDFTTLPKTKRNFYVAASGNYLNRCYTGLNRALCGCNTDRCNGNFKLMLKFWMNSYHENQTKKDCVAEYLRKKENLDPTESSIATENTTAALNATSSDRNMSTKSAKDSTRSNATTAKMSATFAEHPNSSTPGRKTPRILAITQVTSTLVPLNYEDDITPPAQSHNKGGKKRKKSTTKSSIVAYATICVVLLVLLCIVLPLIALCVVYRKRRMRGKTPAKQVLSRQFAKQVPKKSVVVTSQNVKQKQAENVQASRQSSGQSFNWNSLNPQQIPGHSSQSNTRQDTWQSPAQEAQKANKAQTFSKQSQTKKSGGKSRFQFWKRDPHPKADSRMLKTDSTTNTGTAATGSNEIQGLHY